jgi:integrase
MRAWGPTPAVDLQMRHGRPKPGRLGGLVRGRAICEGDWIERFGAHDLRRTYAKLYSKSCGDPTSGKLDF